MNQLPDEFSIQDTGQSAVKSGSHTTNTISSVSIVRTSYDVSMADSKVLTQSVKSVPLEAYIRTRGDKVEIDIPIQEPLDGLSRIEVTRYALLKALLPDMAIASSKRVLVDQYDLARLDEYRSLRAYFVEAMLFFLGLAIPSFVNAQFERLSASPDVATVTVNTTLGIVALVVSLLLLTGAIRMHKKLSELQKQQETNETPITDFINEVLTLVGSQD